MQDRPPGEVVIDLGLREPVAPPSDPYPDWRAWWRRAARRSGRLRWALAVTAALIGGLLAGAATPSDSANVAVVEVMIFDDRQIQLVGDLVLLPNGYTTWGAYDAFTGEHRWTVTAGTHSPTMLEVGELVLQLPAGIARDAETGEIVWRRTWLEAVPELPVGIWPRPEQASPDGARGTVVTGVDLATGEERWEFRLAQGRVWLVAGDQPVVVVTYPDGRVELRDPLTGQVRVSRELPPEQVWLAAEPLLVSGDHLVVGGYRREGVRLSGFRMADLAPAWDWAAPSPLMAIQPCGQAVCLGTASFLVGDPVTRRTVTFDPETGELVELRKPDWELAGLVVAADTGAVLPVNSPDTLLLAAGRLLRLEAATGQLRDPVAPTDTAPVADLTGWRPAVPDTYWADEVRRVPRFVALLPEPADRPGASVAVLYTVTGEITVHPWVPGRPEHCLAAERRLVCRYGAELHVWSW